VSFRCVNAFAYQEKVYGNAAVVEDNDPILATHASHFVRVEEPVRAVETASAAPAEVRVVETKETPVEPVVKSEPVRRRRRNPEGNK